MIRFRDYLWKRIRRPMLSSWLVLVLLSICAYSVVIGFLKSRQLESSLHVAIFTVNQAIQAGDWSLALSHLQALEKAGPVFEITLKAKDGEQNVSGPFGAYPFGVGTVCDQQTTKDAWILRGCMRIFGWVEIYTLGLFLIFAVLVFGMAFRLFRSKSLSMIGQISDELEEMRRDGPAKISGGGEESIQEIIAIRNHIDDLRRQSEQMFRDQAFNELSLQVAHDIRSPLAAFDAFLEDIPQIQIPEKKRVMLRSAISRIRDIANNLLEQRRQQSAELDSAEQSFEAEFLFPLLDSMVSEKRFQHGKSHNVDIELTKARNSHGIFSTVTPNEFKRVISNLIDNAVEAIPEEGWVRVHLSASEERVSIEVSDNGKGIPSEVIPRLMQAGVSYKKPGGTGQGLYYAKKTIESWEGEICVQSVEKEGTKVTITLPRGTAPQWFVEEVRLYSGTLLVIIDDDPSIHEIWKERLATVCHSAEVEMMHFTSAYTFSDWIKENSIDAAKAHFLVDYELIGQEMSGLDLIEEHELAKRSILVTSLYEELSIRRRCRKLGIRLIPKGMAGFVPVNVCSPDTVLIDDDPLVHVIWSERAQKVGKHLSTFKSVDEFLTRSGSFDRSCAVYVDSDLGQNQRGEELAEKIYGKGFKDIHLVTGFPLSETKHVAWIKAVHDKDAPW